MNESEQHHCYEAMFLLDNQEVRKGFNTVRDRVRETLEKHGITVRVLRFWAERALVYPIRSHRRATYMLGWLEAGGEAVNAAKRDFYLVGPVLRCLFLRRESIPEEEMALGIQDVDDSTLVIPDEDADETALAGKPEDEAGTEADQQDEPEGEKEGAADEAPATEEDESEQEVRS